MLTITATQARATFYRLMDEIAASHEPVFITGKRTNAILISEEDWRAIEATMYLLNISGMRESIIEGLGTPVEMCHDMVN